MNYDDLNTAHADIITDLPADEGACCEYGCDTCEPDDTDVVGEAPLREALEPDPEAMYDRLAVLTAEMTDEQRTALGALLLSGAVDTDLLALVLIDQATVESDGTDFVTHSSPGRLNGVPLASEAIETVERAPKYRDDTRLLQCCGRRRLIGHRDGCAEVS